MFHKIYSLHKTDEHGFIHQNEAGLTLSDKNTTQMRFLLHIYSRADTHRCCCSCLLVCLRLLVVLADLEVSQLVRLLVRGHHPQPVAQVVLLQVLLCQVLQIPAEEHWPSEPFPGGSLVFVLLVTLLVLPFGELLLRRHVDLVLHAADLDDVAQIPRLPVHLDLLFKEGLLLDRA